MASEPCSCACGLVTSLTSAGEPCACSCDCCGEHELTQEEEISELHALRLAIDARLEALRPLVGQP